MIKPDSSGDPLVDLVMRGIGCALPTEYASQVTPELYRNLKRRNVWLDAIAQLLCLAGLFGGIFLKLWIRGKPFQYRGWDFGVQIGLAVALPMTFILLIGVFRGRMRLREFLVFYSLKYGMDARKVFFWIYAPMVLFGIVCAYFSYKP